MEGYKKTELGWIPKDWEVKFLEEVCEILYGKDQQEVQHYKGEFNIFGTSGIIGKTNSFIYDKPSVLIGRKGTIDKPIFTAEPFWAVDTLFYTRIFINIHPEWFLLLYEKHKFKEAK
ncbi:MAG: restriction endonuclease subunit S [Candidatus Omnitrophota bacterium]